jgi:pimeloyl-ACP methyl ester carboxylesterase
MLRLRRPSTSDDPIKVVLLHGLGCTTGIWDAFAGRATGPLELWDAELPWHGVDDGGWSRQEDSVRLLVDALSEDYDAVVAHSFAASLLVEAVATGRLEPRPAVLANVFYRPSPDDFDWPTIYRYLNDFHLIFAEALRHGDAAGLPGKHRSWMAEHIRDQIGPYGWMRFFQSYLRSPRLDLTRVHAPQLILTGDTDIATRVCDGQALADTLPHGQLTVLDQCGHFPMVQQPVRFAAAACAFLETAHHRHHAWS